MPPNNAVNAVPSGQSEYDPLPQNVWFIYPPQITSSLYQATCHSVERPPRDGHVYRYEVVKEVELHSVVTGRVQRHILSLPEELSRTHVENLGIFENRYDATVCTMIRAYRLWGMLRAGTAFCVPTIQLMDVQVTDRGLISLRQWFGGNCWYEVEVREHLVPIGL